MTNEYSTIARNMNTDMEATLMPLLESVAQVAQVQYDRSRKTVLKLVHDRLVDSREINEFEFYDIFSALASYSEEVLLHEEAGLGQTEQARWHEGTNAPQNPVARREKLVAAYDEVAKRCVCTGKSIVHSMLEDELHDWDYVKW